MAVRRYPGRGRRVNKTMSPRRLALARRRRKAIGRHNAAWRRSKRPVAKTLPSRETNARRVRRTPEPRPGDPVARTYPNGVIRPR